MEHCNQVVCFRCFIRSKFTVSVGTTSGTFVFPKISPELVLSAKLGPLIAIGDSEPYN